MKRLSLAGFDRLVAAANAIFVIAISAAVLGLLCSPFTGRTIRGLTIGAHCLLGAVIGFCLGAVATAVGGRRGWAFAGVICGLAAALFAVASLPEDHSARHYECGLSIFSVFLFLSVSFGIGGNYLGKRIADLLEGTPEKAGAFEPFARLLQSSRLYDVPLGLRLALALLQVTPFLVLLPGALRYLSSR